MIEQSNNNEEFKELHNKLDLLEKKLNKVDHQVKQFNQLKPVKPETSIYEIFKKQKSFIDHKKRWATVSKDGQKPTFGTRNNREASISPNQTLPTFDFKEPAKRLFSPNNQINRHKINISNPRTLINDFSIKFTDLGFSRVKSPSKVPFDVESSRFMSEF